MINRKYAAASAVWRIVERGVRKPCRDPVSPSGCNCGPCTSRELHAQVGHLGDPPAVLQDVFEQSVKGQLVLWTFGFRSVRRLFLDRWWYV